MPTRNRSLFVEQSLRYFLRQDYPNKELIIIDDGVERLGDVLPDDRRIRYVHHRRPMSIGEKRNLACAMAQGMIIAQWDDDDWYGQQRLSHQVIPLLEGVADITGLETECFFDIRRGQAWSISPALHARMFVGDVHGGTLVFWRWVWEQLSQYPHISIAEDAVFLQGACRRGARLQKVREHDSFVYVRHGRNAWGFTSGSHDDPAQWQTVPVERYMSAEDKTFYTQFVQPEAQSRLTTGRSLPHHLPVRPQQPHVTCIMPTRNRRTFVPHAIRHFLRQDFLNSELFIMDDGDDPVSDLVPSHPRIRYVRLDDALVLGTKRNVMCDLARGDLIAHWDDDDWMAAHRLGYQIAMLEQHEADLCGINRQLYYDLQADRAWHYEYPLRRRFWVSGSSLLYRKSLWERNPFPDVPVAEDTAFIWGADAATPMLALPEIDFMIGLIHEHNTSHKHIAAPYWTPHPVHEIDDLVGSDLDALVMQPTLAL